MLIQTSILCISRWTIFGRSSATKRSTSTEPTFSVVSQRPPVTKTPVWRTARCFLCFGYGGVIMRRRELRGVTHFLAISASVVSACVCVLLTVGEWHEARSNLNTHDREYQGWQAFRQTNAAYYDDNKEAVSSCLTSLKAAQDNFWLQRSTVELGGLFIVAGLGSAAGGYLVTWGLLWFIGMGIQRFMRWLSLRSRPKPKRPLDSESAIEADVPAEQPLTPRELRESQASDGRTPRKPTTRSAVGSLREKSPSVIEWT